MRLRLILAVLLVGVAVACGGGGGNTSWGSGPSGTVSLRFGSDSFPGYDQAVVSLEKVEATTDGSSWVPVGTVQGTYDLMALQNGRSVEILSSASLAAGTYTQFRLTWAAKNYSDSTRMPAYVYPSGATGGQVLSMPATTVVPGPVTVAVNATTRIQVMLSGQQAVQVRAGTAPYTFQATGQAYDLAKTASLTGHLTDGTTPLVGAEVFAETVDGLQVATLQRRAFTDATGSYLLECLPASSSTAYFVVSQPGDTVTAYAAVASAPIQVTSGTTRTDLAFSGTQQSGSLTLTINPPSLPTVGTWGELRQNLATGPGLFNNLIVRSQSAVSGATQDQVYFTGLAPSYYGVTAERSTAGATPVTKAYGSPVQVLSGATASVNVSYP